MVKRDLLLCQSSTVPSSILQQKSTYRPYQIDIERDNEYYSVANASVTQNNFQRVSPALKFPNRTFTTEQLEKLSVEKVAKKSRT